MDNFVQSHENYSSLFEDKNKYNAIMSVLAKIFIKRRAKQNNIGIYETYTIIII